MPETPPLPQEQLEAARHRLQQLLESGKLNEFATDEARAEGERLQREIDRLEAELGDKK